ncbi:RimJ/RimL family protein N-acetyltransferase [Paramicrobacterium agarici]|uniref:RimJ/RimL family protein N-acetyltransferase n=1 Tax=Paramicrobacterium agarici TaxID=630514 RepID=A0A2A9DU80_9MICO|nr:GNAT family protein [Microbacterium agarici]PFG30337.1 RimJ/RimL family protein N-acetyltransferase [Microbacterium agarici]
MSAVVPEPRALTGHVVRLDPLTAADASDLYAAIVRPEVYEFGYGGGAAGMPRDAAEFAETLTEHYPFASGIPFVVRLVDGPAAGRVVGTTSLGDLDVAHRGAHIGWTAYRPDVWGTAVNPECKLLLMSLAFGCGFERVKIQTDAVNARSRAAITKLGATFEGVLRHHRLRADGTWRDTAVYSILAEEWPEIRESLELRLERETRKVTLET